LIFKIPTTERAAEMAQKFTVKLMLRLKGIFTGESQINFIKNDEMMKDLETRYTQK
jgi:hypothetical protein